MEASALRYSGRIGLHGRSPVLRLQSDERLIALTRRGNQAAFEALVCRYESRLLAFCRHLLGSREDAEDVLQEVLAAAFNAILADERPINVRPWLYRIARNRSLNHLRRVQAVGVDSMDVHLSENGATTADKVHDREDFRLLVGDIQELPETQRTALVLREMDALSYEQIAETMDTTVPSVKSLLVRARISLAEAAEARLLSCDEVRIELGEVAEGLARRPSPPVRRHLKGCARCDAFRSQLKQTNKALTALLPVGPFVALRKLLTGHGGHAAGAGKSASGAGASGASASGATGSTIAGTSAAVGSGAGGLITAGVGAIVTKAAASLAAAALLTAGAVEVSQVAQGGESKADSDVMAVAASAANAVEHNIAALGAQSTAQDAAQASTADAKAATESKTAADTTTTSKTSSKATPPPTTSSTASTPTSTTPTTSTPTTSTPTTTSPPPTTTTTASDPTPPTPPPTSPPPPSGPPPGRTQSQNDPTVLPTPPATSPSSGGPMGQSGNPQASGWSG